MFEVQVWSCSSKSFFSTTKFVIFKFGLSIQNTIHIHRNRQRHPFKCHKNRNFIRILYNIQEPRLVHFELINLFVILGICWICTRHLDCMVYVAGCCLVLLWFLFFVFKIFFFVFVSYIQSIYVSSHLPSWLLFIIR